MEVKMFETLLESMLQCVCDLWDSADSPEHKKLLVRRLDELLLRLKGLEEKSLEKTLADDVKRPVGIAVEDSRSVAAIQAIAQPARDLLSVMLSSTGLLENYELKLSPERRAEEFQKISKAVQDFARLLDEVSI